MGFRFGILDNVTKTWNNEVIIMAIICYNIESEISGGEVEIKTWETNYGSLKRRN